MKDRTLPTGISLRKDGLFMWRFKYSGIVYCGYAHKLADAKKALNDKRYEVEHGLSSKEKAITLDAWFEEWINTYKMIECKDSTIYMYKCLYREYIKPDFGQVQLKKIRPDMIQKSMNQLIQTHCKSTVVRVRNLFSSCLQQAVKNGFISKNPASDITVPKTTQDKKRALSVDDEKAFFEAAKTSRYFELYKLASLTGMRIGEITGLEWSEIDFDKGIIHITHTLSYTTEKGLYLSTPKTESSRRDIPFAIGGEIYNLLKARRKEQMTQRIEMGTRWNPQKGLENLVFTTQFGGGIVTSDVGMDTRKIRAELKEKGIDLGNFSFHTLRHCFATRAIENGMNPKTLQAILGHSDFKMTMNLYCDTMEETKREEMEKLEIAL